MAYYVGLSFSDVMTNEMFGDLRGFSYLFLRLTGLLTNLKKEYFTRSSFLCCCVVHCHLSFRVILSKNVLVLFFASL